MPPESAVIAGVDGSERSADALALAVELAEALGAALQPVFVHPYGPLARSLPEAEYEKFVQELADSVHSQLRALDLPAERRTLEIVSDRSAAAGLERVARREGALVVVVGGSGRSRAGRVLPGGTAERLLSGAPCPVAIAPAGHAGAEHALRLVGVGIDSSADSHAALDWAAELTESLGAKLRLLTVHQHLPPISQPLDVGVPLAPLDSSLREALAERLVRAEEELHGHALDVTSALLDGDPARALAEASRHLDLLVLGSRGYGPLGAVLVGSVSNALVRTAECPVLIVPRSSEPPAEEA